MYGMLNYDNIIILNCYHKQYYEKLQVILSQWNTGTSHYVYYRPLKRAFYHFLPRYFLYNLRQSLIFVFHNFCKQCLLGLASASELRFSEGNLSGIYGSCA